MTLSRRALLLTLPVLGMAGAVRAEAAPRVVMETALGLIVIELYPEKAPVTVANFLRYVDAGRFAGASFYRVVRPDNDNNPAVITVIQGGLNLPDDAPSPFPSIAHETTAVTGLKHTDGVISMARGAPGTASSEVFICIGDNPALDHGGARNADGQGFAAFGRVVSGMEVVRAINALRETAPTEDAYMRGQILMRPVAIAAVRRQP